MIAAWLVALIASAGGSTASGGDGSLAAATALIDRAEHDADANDLATARGTIATAFATVAKLEAFADPHLDDRDLEAALARIGRLAKRAGALDVSLDAREQLVARLAARSPNDDLELTLARVDLAESRFARGDAKSARALEEPAIAVLEKSLPDDHPDLQRARNSLATSLATLGDVGAARALEERVVAVREKTLPADDRDRLTSRLNLAVMMRMQKDLAKARAIQEDVVAILEKNGPEDDPLLASGRQNLANTLKDMGEIGAAAALERRALAAREKNLPDDHPDLQRSRLNLAATLKDLGDPASARALEEKVLAIRERTLPDDHPDLQAVRTKLAISLKQQGRLSEARALDEKVLAIDERTLPDDHRDLQAVRINLANILNNQGDLPAARALSEKAIEVFERTRSEDDPDLQSARVSLAVTLLYQGDAPAAVALNTKILAVRERTLAKDDPELATARLNLAASLSAIGDVAGARALEEKVLAIQLESRPPDHPETQIARLNLASSLKAQGDLRGANALEEQALAAYEKALPDDHLYMLAARLETFCSRLALGDVERARSLLRVAANATRAMLAELFAASPREAAERTRYAHDPIMMLLAFGETKDDEATVFSLVATCNALAARCTDSNPAPAEARLAVRTARNSLSDRALAGPRRDETPEAWRDAVDRLRRARDEAEATVIGALRSKGFPADVVTAESVAKALPERHAAAHCIVAPRCSVEPVRGVVMDADALFVQIVLRDGTIRRVDLGNAADVEAAVKLWRAAARTSVARGRPVPETSDAESEEKGAGVALRRLVLDPIVAASGGADVLHFTPVGALDLAPLEALPDDDGTPVGRRVRIVIEPSFVRLIQPPKTPVADASLVLLGGVDYGMGGASTKFGPLLQTRFEIDAIAALFEDAFHATPTVLEKQDASKAKLVPALANARYVHLATHGWFAPDSIASWDDAPRSDSSHPFTTSQRPFEGLAPSVLCGLALAGANQPQDELGRMPGIITAEELAGLDLSHCSICILSACETNVADRHAGPGMHSLQAAVHAAGARCAITSLWRVDDAATRRLMELFYAELWTDKVAAAEALWKAKMQLRGEGAPTRDWAGFVLSGDADAR